MKKHRGTLTPEGRRSLQDLIAAGKASAKGLAYARTLLQADAAPDGPGWADQRIAEAVEVSVATVARVRQRLVVQGLEAASVREPQDRPGRQRKRDGRAEAHPVALAGSKPPERRDEWTMQLLADKMVELQIVEAISDETVRRTLQKTS